MESRGGMVERSDFNAFRDGHIPKVQILSWGIRSQQNGSGRVPFLHLTETKLMKRLSLGFIRGGSNLRKHEDVGRPLNQATVKGASQGASSWRPPERDPFHDISIERERGGEGGEKEG